MISVKGETYGFDIAKGCQEMLLEGLDQIGVTMKKAHDIMDFERVYRERRAWLFG